MLFILKSGALDPDWEARDHAGPSGVCLSRSFEEALGHARSRTDHIGDIVYDYFNIDHIPSGVLGCVFEFERSRIENKLVAFDDFGIGEGGEGDEEEERAIGKLSLDALTGIYLDPDRLSAFRSDMVKIAEAHPKEGSYYLDLLPILDGLATDPLVKPMKWPI